jgi:hypothetical protein
MTQSDKGHAGMFGFGSQITVQKVCEYIRSGHIFGRHTVTTPNYAVVLNSSCTHPLISQLSQVEQSEANFSAASRESTKRNFLGVVSLK